MQSGEVPFRGVSGWWTIAADGSSDPEQPPRIAEVEAPLPSGRRSRIRS